MYTDYILTGGNQTMNKKLMLLMLTLLLVLAGCGQQPAKDKAPESAARCRGRSYIKSRNAHSANDRGA